MFRTHWQADDKCLDTTKRRRFSGGSEVKTMLMVWRWVTASGDGERDNLVLQIERVLFKPGFAITKTEY